MYYIKLNLIEFSALNSAMDQLQAALDTLESRNAGIHEELLQLLQSNREIRLGINAYEETDGAQGEAGSVNEDDQKNNETASGTVSHNGDANRSEPSTTDRERVESLFNMLDSFDSALISQLADISVTTDMNALD